MTFWDFLSQASLYQWIGLIIIATVLGQIRLVTVQYRNHGWIYPLNGDKK